jgi:hypothetical protein
VPSVGGGQIGEREALAAGNGAGSYIPSLPPLRDKPQAAVPGLGKLAGEGVEGDLAGGALPEVAGGGGGEQAPA